MAKLNSIPLPKRALDVTGMTFGLLTALRPVRHVTTPLPVRIYWLCQCECGNTCERTAGALRRSGHSSCGCEMSRTTMGRRSITHNLSSHPNFRLWCAMRNRCYMKSNLAYKYYGGRGIRVCDRWLESFANFVEDMGERPNGKSIDRIDNDGDYTPENCKWSTPKEQGQNKRDYVHGVKHYTVGNVCMTIRGWSAYTGINRDTIRGRLRRGWSIKSAMTKSVRHLQPKSY